MKTRQIDRAVFQASKLIESGEPKENAISLASIEFEVSVEKIAEYFKLVLLPHERNQ